MRLGAVAVCVIAGLLVFATPCAAHDSAHLAPGFQIVPVLDGLVSPTAVRFSADGRMFVIEKRGIVKVFDSVDDTSAQVVADLSLQVLDYWDRGLLGLAVDPGFPTEPFLYVLYTLDHNPLDPQSSVPYWQDDCPSPPGPTHDGCVANARLSRLEVGPDNVLVGPEQVLVENRWCQQFPSHSVGDLAFDATGALIVSAGDAASFIGPDYGQHGGGPESPTPPNPCGDPPVGSGGNQSPPHAEGGALRAQDLRTAGDPVGFNGAIIRVDPATGAAHPTNPLIGGDPADDRVVAYGLRNPFRIAVRPTTNEVYVADVGWLDWEEIDLIGDYSSVKNFGWPCYEGPDRQPGYDALDLTICEDLYADVASPAEPPFFAYEHGVFVDPDPEPIQCPRTNSASITGLAFYDGAEYPSYFLHALFLADYANGCVFYMTPGPTGRPEPESIQTLATDVEVVDLQLGPDGKIYFLGIESGTLRRFEFAEDNDDPTAVLAADRTHGALPLVVQFDGSGSTDPNPFDTLTFEWDLDGDGAFDDSGGAEPSFTYLAEGDLLVRLRVTDESGGTDTAELRVVAGNTAPVASILEPVPPLLWAVGDSIHFDGVGLDPEEGTLPAAAMRWDLALHHCPGDCHVHGLTEFLAVSVGDFTAPDHDWYSYLELCLTITDSGLAGGGGVLEGTTCVRLEPNPIELSFETLPPGLEVTVGAESLTTPAGRTVIEGSSVSLGAPASQGPFDWHTWSDGGERVHIVAAPAAPQTFVATYTYHPQGGPALPYLLADRAGLVWTAAAAPYDVIRGSLELLRDTRGDFTAAVEECVEDDVAGTAVPYSVDPLTGIGDWLLVRSDEDGTGSYDSGGAEQAGSRDAEIVVAPLSCP